MFVVQVLGGSISGSEKLISAVRNLHNVIGGALNPITYPYRKSWPDDVLYRSGYLEKHSLLFSLMFN